MSRRSSSLKSRLRQIEEAKGGGAVTLEFSDGAKRGFNVSRNGRLQILVGSFDLACMARNPDAKPSVSPRALEIARLIGEAERITPHDRLWDTVAGIVRQVEEEKGETHAPSPASS